MKIIIYGLGESRKYIEKCLKKEHMVVGYSDSKSRIEIFNGKKFFVLSQLLEVEYDYIVLSIESYSVCKSIIKMLVNDFGIKKNKIIDFWHYYYTTLENNIIDYKILKCKKIDGLILGLSHGEVGLNTEYLNGEWCNLAISSQDLYSNYQVLKYSYNKYTEKFIGLKYAIIDMFDWTYFNYDTSLAKNALNYIGRVNNIEGILHNLDKNCNIEGNINDWINNTGLNTANYERCLDKKAVMEELFTDIHKEEWVYRKYNEIKRYGMIEENSNDYFKPEYMPSFAKKRYNSTIVEMKKSFQDILKLLYYINKNIKIYAILIPRYITIENIHLEKYRKWKEEFQIIIDEMRQIYPFEFWNFKEYKPISQNNNFYYDVSHLNEIGSIALTSIINKKIYEDNNYKN